MAFGEILAVIPSGAAQRRSRGIAEIPVEGPVLREERDSSTPALRAAAGMTNVP